MIVGVLNRLIIFERIRCGICIRGEGEEKWEEAMRDRWKARDREEKR